MEWIGMEWKSQSLAPLPSLSSSPTPRAHTIYSNPLIHTSIHHCSCTNARTVVPVVVQVVLDVEPEVWDVVRVAQQGGLHASHADEGVGAEAVVGPAVRGRGDRGDEGVLRVVKG